MTEPTIKLNFSLLEGIEPGTEEYGVATLKQIMDFALGTIEEITMLAALAHDRGDARTPVVGAKALQLHIAEELYNQSVRHAELFAEGAKDIWPHIVKYWLEANKFNFITSDADLWIDMKEVVADYNAAQEVNA